MLECSLVFPTGARGSRPPPGRGGECTPAGPSCVPRDRAGGSSAPVGAGTSWARWLSQFAGRLLMRLVAGHGRSWGRGGFHEAAAARQHERRPIPVRLRPPSNDRELPNLQSVRWSRPIAHNRPHSCVHRCGPAGFFRLAVALISTRSPGRASSLTPMAVQAGYGVIVKNRSLTVTKTGRSTIDVK